MQKVVDSQEIRVFQAEEKTYQVIDTIKDEGKIAHVIEGDCNLNIGQIIHGKINWELRYRFMRMHTTMHLLCSIFLFMLLVVKLVLKKVELILI